jgi:hypothetical protein
LSAQEALERFDPKGIAGGRCNGHQADDDHEGCGRRNDLAEPLTVEPLDRKEGVDPDRDYCAGSEQTANSG